MAWLTNCIIYIGLLFLKRKSPVILVKEPKIPKFSLPKELLVVGGFLATNAKHLLILYLYLEGNTKRLDIIKTVKSLHLSDL